MVEFDDLYEASAWIIRDMQSKIKLNKDKWIALQEAKKTIDAAGKFFNSNDAEEEQFQMSMDFMEQEMANTVGNVQRFLEKTTSIMDNIDLQKGALSTKGQELLAEFQNQTIQPCYRQVM